MRAAFWIFVHDCHGMAIEPAAFAASGRGVAAHFGDSPRRKAFGGFADSIGCKCGIVCPPLSAGAWL